MIHLLINAGATEESAHWGTVFGGTPSVPLGNFVWPMCSFCGNYMQFLGQIRTSYPGATDDRLLLLFMCQNDPGCCEEWNPDGGGNKVIPVTQRNLALAEVPNDGLTRRAARYGTVTKIVDASDYSSAVEMWLQGDNAKEHLLGQLGGKPLWLGNEVLPRCSDCGERMYFVAQLEEGPRPDPMQFGGGKAYVFECRQCDDSAKMLFQC